MRYGIVMPFGDAAEIADAAALAERSGWDALFVWEAVWGVDAWVALTAAAMRTSTLRLGTMLTPVPRLKPWDLASRVLTLDQLSGGRVTLGVGLGALHEGWTAFEPDEGRRVRVEKLDEALAIYAGLMGGQPFSFEGRHYTRQPHRLHAAGPAGPAAAPAGVAGRRVAGRRDRGSRRWSGRRAGRDGCPRSSTATGGATRAAPTSWPRCWRLVRAAREAAGLPWQGFDVCVEGELHGDDPLRSRRRRLAGGRSHVVGRGRLGPAAHTGRPGGADPAGRRRPATGMTAAPTAGRRPRPARTSHRERLRRH